MKNRIIIIIITENINMPIFVYQYMSTLSLHSQKAAKAHKAALDMINALSTNRVRTSSRNLGLRIVMLYFSKFFFVWFNISDICLYSNGLHTSPRYLPHYTAFSFYVLKGGLELELEQKWSIHIYEDGTVPWVASNRCCIPWVAIIPLIGL